MLELHKIEPNYVYSLNAFVSIFVHAVSIAPQFERTANLNVNRKKKIAPALSKFQSAVGRVISCNRFEWNSDQLRDARLPTSHLNGNPSDETSALLLDTKGIDNSLREKLQSIDQDAREDIQSRCADLLQRISLSCFQYLHRSVCHRHKLTLAVLFTFKVMQQSGDLNKELVLTLLNMDGGQSRSSSGSTVGNRGSSARPGGISRPPGQVEEWMTPAAWGAVLDLQSTVDLSRLATDISSDADLWADWFHLLRPEEESLPAPYDTMGPDSVARLTITRALRPDRLPALLRKFVSSKMGEQYVSRVEIYRYFHNKT